jgi:hypothetical protein
MDDPYHLTFLTLEQRDVSLYVSKWLLTLFGLSDVNGKGESQNARENSRDGS